MENLLIKNVQIIDCSQNFLGDIYIENGKISLIGKKIEKKCKNIIDGRGKTLVPSFIDVHVHFREPGYEYKEDIESGSKSAVRGGFTFVNLMGNTDPICSDMETVKNVLKRVKEVGLIEAHQTVSITNNFSGDDLRHLDKLDLDVVKTISDDGKGVLNSKVMLDAMIKAKKNGLVIMAHAEDEQITPHSYRLSENIETIRDIELAKYTGVRLHLSHVSTREAMMYIVQAKAQGYKNITCEVSPHHISLNNKDIDYKVNPPLRNEDDREFLIWAIENDMVDMISTDHAPHTKNDKEKGMPGLVGLETAFSISYTTLVRSQLITIEKLTKLMSKNPAKLYGLNKGEIKIGYDADLVLIDMDKKIKVKSENFESKGKNTPFEGMEFYGEILTTIRSGCIVYSKEEH